MKHLGLELKSFGNVVSLSAQMPKSDCRRIVKTVDRLGLERLEWCETLASFIADHVGADLRVVVYDAMVDEVDLEPWIKSLDRPHERLCVTRTPEQGFELSLHPWGVESEVHAYGYRQPSRDAERVALGSVGAVLVPALAFDPNGVRLGRGRGYYDRFLARLPADCLFIGMTAGLIATELPSEPFDVAMTHLATADRVLKLPIELA